MPVDSNGMAPPSNRKRWFILGLGVLAQAIFSASISGIPVAGVVLRSEFSLSNVWIGIIAGAIYLGISVSEIPWGIVTDRAGERIILTLGTCATGIVLLTLWGGLSLNGMVSGFWIALAMFFMGAFGGSINGSSGKAVMGWFSERERGLAMGIRQTAMPLGGAIGAAFVPAVGAATSMKVSFLLLGLLTVAVSVACYMWIEEPRRESILGDPKEFGSINSGDNPLRDGRVWRLALASMFLTVPQFAILAFAAVFLIDVFHTPLFVASSALVLVQVLGGIARILAGHLTDRRFERMPTLRWMSVLAAASLFMLSVLSSTNYSWPVVIMVIIAGTVANAWHGVAYTEIASIVPHKAATALGLENTAVFAMGFITPLVIPIVLSSAGWILVWILSAIACSVSALVLFKVKGV